MHVTEVYLKDLLKRYIRHDWVNFAANSINSHIILPHTLGMTQIKRDLTESFEVYCLHTLANLQYIDRLTTKILVNKKSSQQKTNFEPNFLSLIDRLTKAHYLLQYKFL